VLGSARGAGSSGRSGFSDGSEDMLPKAEKLPPQHHCFFEMFV
jgi:hypothetical protein